MFYKITSPWYCLGRCRRHWCRRFSVPSMFLKIQIPRITCSQQFLARAAQAQQATSSLALEPEFVELASSILRDTPSYNIRQKFGLIPALMHRLMEECIEQTLVLATADCLGLTEDTGQSYDRIIESARDHGLHECSLEVALAFSLAVPAVNDRAMILVPTTVHDASYALAVQRNARHAHDVSRDYVSRTWPSIKRRGFAFRLGEASSFTPTAHARRLLVQKSGSDKLMLSSVAAA